MSSLAEPEIQDSDANQQVHDHFFVRSMSDLRVAKDFLRQHLPANLVNAFDLNSLGICKDKWVHLNLKAKITDILYKVKFKNSNDEAYLLTLIEHQSTPQKHKPVRALYYEAIIMYNHWNNYKTVPLVYTVVYYNGQEPWNYSHDIKDLRVFSKVYNKVFKMSACLLLKNC